MARGREEHLDGGGRLLQGHQEVRHHPHPGADPAGQLEGGRNTIQIVHIIAKTRITNTLSYGHHLAWLPTMKTKPRVDPYMVEYTVMMLGPYMYVEVGMDYVMMENGQRWNIFPLKK
jgi:hypothetical protein